MNCRDFSATVVDLARSPMMDASVRDEALEHAAGCHSCAARLADERSLSAGFRALAAVESQRVAQRWRETELRAAFRNQLDAGGTAVEVATGGMRSRLSGWALVAAAAIVMLLGGAVVWRLSSSGSPAPPNVVRQKTGDPAQGLSKESQKAGGPLPVEARLEGPMLVSRRGTRQNLPRVRLTGPADTASVAVILGEFQPIASEEQTTDFLPIVESPQMRPLDSGQVIRVDMPRSAMSYFGLPLQVDRPDGRVKADVLVGEDGLARAIRFVR